MTQGSGHPSPVKGSRHSLPQVGRPRWTFAHASVRQLVSAMVALLSSAFALGAVAPAQAAETASASGKVTYPTGVDVSRGQTTVWFYPVTAAGAVSGRTYVYEVAANGTYSVTGLPAGRYKLLFDSTGRAVADEYWDNKSSFETATIFTLAAGETRKGLNAALGEGGDRLREAHAPRRCDGFGRRHGRAGARRSQLLALRLRRRRRQRQVHVLRPPPGDLPDHSGCRQGGGHRERLVEGEARLQLGDTGHRERRPGPYRRGLRPAGGLDHLGEGDLP